MKSYREIADSVFERRDQYVIARRKKKQAITRVTASVGSVALVSLAGIALLQSDAFNDSLPLTDDAVTATTAEPADGTTTTATTAASGVLPPTATATTITVPPQSTTTGTAELPTTTISDKTEPSKTTATTTAPKKRVIAATKPDYEFQGEALCSKYKIYISSRLKQYMEMFEDEDVNYAVIVSIPPLSEDYEDSEVCNEELIRALQESKRVYGIFEEEAKQLNPSWNTADAKEIEVWTDTMRANYEQYCLLVDRYHSLAEQHRGPYIQSLLDRRLEVLQGVSDAPLVDVECYELTKVGFTWHIYYAELSAETINVLAEQGGYTFSLAMFNQKDYGYWDVDE